MNILDGQARIDVPTLSVPGDPNLKFDFVQNSMPYLNGKVSGAPGDYAQSSYSVHYGGSSSESFSCVEDVCRSIKQNGSTLEGSVINVGIVLFTAKGSGALYTFDQLNFDSGVTNPRDLRYYASRVDYPDGQVLTYTYESVHYPGDPRNRTLFRPVRITSNLGYFIAVSYQSADPNAVAAWQTVAQATIYAANAPTTPLGQLTYSSTAITDLAGRTYYCSGCVNQVGANLELASGSMTLPGEGSPAEIVTGLSTGVTTPAVVSSVMQDGVNWTYAYGNIRPVNLANAYDSVVVSGPAGYYQTYNMTAATVGSAANSINSITDALGRTTSYLYDATVRPTFIGFPEGNSVRVTYDTYGNIVAKVTKAKPGSGLADIAESSAIDANGCAQSRVLCSRPVWYRDGLGRQTDYAYNLAGQLTQQTDPADTSGVRRATIVSYDASSGISRRNLVRVCGLGTTCNTSAEIRTQYTYWGNTFLPATETRVDGVTGTSLTTTYTYDTAGRTLSVDGPLPGTADAKYFRYDVLGRKTWEIAAANADGSRPATHFIYRDADDKVVAVETGNIPDATSSTLNVFSRIDTSYDAHRNPARVATSSGGTTYKVADQFVDDRGQQVCATVRMNAAAFGALPASACTLGPQGSLGPRPGSPSKAMTPPDSCLKSRRPSALASRKTTPPIPTR